jgi:hypothetical protein
MRLLVFLSLFALLSSCGTKTEDTSLDFLTGTWKRENMERYEVWEQVSPQELKGYSYKLENGEKIITETLVIRKDKGQFVYEATVPDQNEGKTVPFTLNPAIDSLLSFENASHDFPKKIQYQLLEEGKIKVMVWGEDNKGFSFIQLRQ